MRLTSVFVIFLVSFCGTNVVIEGALLASSIDDVCMKQPSSECGAGLASLTLQAHEAGQSELADTMIGHFSRVSIDYAVDYMNQIANVSGVVCWGTKQGAMLNSLLGILAPEPLATSSPAPGVEFRIMTFSLFHGKKFMRLHSFWIYIESI